MSFPLCQVVGLIPPACYENLTVADVFNRERCCMSTRERYDILIARPGGIDALKANKMVLVEELLDLVSVVLLDTTPERTVFYYNDGVVEEMSALLKFCCLTTEEACQTSTVLISYKKTNIIIILVIEDQINFDRRYVFFFKSVDSAFG